MDFQFNVFKIDEEYFSARRIFLERAEHNVLLPYGIMFISRLRKLNISGVGCLLRIFSKGDMS